jgi:pimeloyl-ACP methyl ester carboxylesterase
MRSFHPYFTRRFFFALLLILTLVPLPAAAGRPVPPGSEAGENPDRSIDQPAGLSVTPLGEFLTPADLGNTLVGSGITISNVIYSGANHAAGLFSGGTDIIGIEEGILLTSGSVYNVPGPNYSNSISTANYLPGDPDLDALSGYTTFDATILSFDFVPNSDYVYFQYVFASDEYNEYVNTSFNDVFAFYVNGQNCALLNDLPVSINTINNGNPFGSEPRSNWEFYINNDIASGAQFDTEMDGFTVVLTCASQVVPNQTNHLKLAIADASDHIYDSAVFLRAGSITTEKRPVILLPGMMASINYTCFLEWPIIFGSLSCNLDELWWFAPTAKGYYKPFMDRLEASGYRKDNSYFSVFHYDWRQPLSFNVTRLKAHIDRIKDETGQEMVDLVGHSMGGLVARTYVQSALYQTSGNDVAHLVTVGSPHKGAAESYPVWEAADPVLMDLDKKVIFYGLLTYYMKQQLNPIPVYALRNAFPSTKDLLPTEDYLRRDDNGEPVPESEMVHRNTFMAGMNSSLDQLFERTEVATIAAEGSPTLNNIFVNQRPWWMPIIWDDGIPNWDREEESYSNVGDKTVMAFSALLEGSSEYRFVPPVGGDPIEHGVMLTDNNVINRIFVYLQISAAPEIVPFEREGLLAFFLDGDAQALVTDPLGRSLSPENGLGTLSDVEPIPDSLYASVEGNPFKLIFIAAPLDGEYQIDIRGLKDGQATFGLLDIYDREDFMIEDIMDFWQTSTLPSAPGSSAVLQVHFSDGEQTAQVLLSAETPVIHVPLWAGSSLVEGRGVPDKVVEIRSASTDAVLGTAVVGEDGIYVAALAAPLKLKDRVYPWSEGMAGAVVAAQPHTIFLPFNSR